QVVVADEQRQTAPTGHTLVLPDAAHKARILAGGLQRRRNVLELHARSIRQQFAGTLGGDRLRELGVDRQRVAREHRNSHAGAAHKKLRDFENLAALVAQLLLLVGLVETVVDDAARKRNHVKRNVLRE